MNKERILDLADIIENDRLPLVRFDINWWARREYESPHECGTIACIAGYAVAAAYGNRIAKHFKTDVGGEARRILGLTVDEARELFSDGWRTLKPRPTNKQAARVLRHLAATGKVDWSIALAEGKQ